MNTKVKIEERVQKLVAVIGEGAHSRRELMAALGLRQESRRNFYDNYMKPATARGLVTMQCPEHPSIPEQVYRLTANGLEYLEELSKKEQAKSEKEKVKQKRNRLGGNGQIVKKRNRLKLGTGNNLHKSRT